MPALPELWMGRNQSQLGRGLWSRNQRQGGGEHRDAPPRECWSIPVLPDLANPRCSRAFGINSLSRHGSGRREC